MHGYLELDANVGEQGTSLRHSCSLSTSSSIPQWRPTCATTPFVRLRKRALIEKHLAPQQKDTTTIERQIILEEPGALARVSR
jgi:hypothetical protein